MLVLDQERSASATFLDQVLRPTKDVAFVIHFDREVELLQDVTASRQKLQAALELLETPQFTRRVANNSPGSWPGSHQRGGGTLLYDAVYLASNEEMMKSRLPSEIANRLWTAVFLQREVILGQVGDDFSVFGAHRSKHVDHPDVDRYGRLLLAAHRPALQ